VERGDGVAGRTVLGKDGLRRRAEGGMPAIQFKQWPCRRENCSAGNASPDVQKPRF